MVDWIDEGLNWSSSSDEMLKEIKYRLDVIQRKPPSRWTQEEQEYYKSATDRLMKALLAKTN